MALNKKIRTYFPDERDYTCTSMAYETLSGGVCVAYFDYPKNLHALTSNQQQETFLILEHAKRDQNCRVLVWTATGQKAFNSGAAFGKSNIEPVLAPEVAEAYRKRHMGIGNLGDAALKAETLAFWDFPKPVIMAINGLAVGGGANVALMNYGDLVLCSTNARFLWPFAKLGLSPELGSSVMLANIVGMPNAKKIMMLGEWLSANEAFRMGLVNEICEPDQLLDRAVNVARKIAACSPATLFRIKDIMNKQIRKGLPGILDEEGAYIEAGIEDMIKAVTAKQKKNAKAKL